MYKNVVALCK